MEILFFPPSCLASSNFLFFFSFSSSFSLPSFLLHLDFYLSSISSFLLILLFQRRGGAELTCNKMSYHVSVKYFSFYLKITLPFCFVLCISLAIWKGKLGARGRQTRKERIGGKEWRAKWYIKTQHN